MKRVLTIITFIWLCTYIAATNVPRTISGTVIDEKGESMIGVHVAVKRNEYRNYYQYRW